MLFLRRGCLFQSMLTAHSSASPAVISRSRLHQMSYCRDVRDVVDTRGMGESRGSSPFAWSTFPWQQKQHGGVFPSQAGKALLLFQKHPKWVRQGRADSSLQLLLQLCPSVCVLCFTLGRTSTHTKRNDTTENQTGKVAVGRKKNNKRNHNLSVTVEFICREDFCCRTTRSEILRFWCLLFSEETPLLLPNHHSVSLETKKWQRETYSVSVVKTNTGEMGKVQLQICGSVIEGEQSRGKVRRQKDNE